MKFPPDYPYSPPSIRFMTKVWHPNVYEVSEYTGNYRSPACSPFLSLLLSVSPPRFDPFQPVHSVYIYTCVSFPSVRLPCVPFPFIRPAFTPLIPPLTVYNDHPALSVRPFVCPLYFPPSVAIAFTSISFYIVTFSACETTRVRRNRRLRSLPSKRVQRGGCGARAVRRGEGKKKVKNDPARKITARCRCSSRRSRLHLYILTCIVTALLYLVLGTSGRTIFIADSHRHVRRL